jgi:hypothetical protein
MRITPAEAILSDDDIAPKLRPFIEALLRRDGEDSSTNIAPTRPLDANEESPSTDRSIAQEP